jgi:hypothetical protein
MRCVGWKPDTSIVPSLSMERSHIVLVPVTT